MILPPMAAWSGISKRWRSIDRKSTRLNSSHTVIYTLSLHDALPILALGRHVLAHRLDRLAGDDLAADGGLERDLEEVAVDRSEEHTSELQSHSDLHSFPTRRSSDLSTWPSRSCPPT